MLLLLIDYLLNLRQTEKDYRRNVCKNKLGEHIHTVISQRIKYRVVCKYAAEKLELLKVFKDNKARKDVAYKP